MPRKTIEVLQCDRCKADGTPYQVTYEDGTKEFILCSRHNTQLEKLREADYGTWRRKGRRSTFKKVNLEDIETDAQK